MRRVQDFKDMIAGIAYEVVFTLLVIAWAGCVAAAALFLGRL
jgi:hypothetical protein